MRSEEIVCLNEKPDLKGFSQYLYQQEKAFATIQKYNTDLRTFYAFLGNDQRIDKERLLKYKDWLSRNYAVRSANSMIAALNNYLEYMNMPLLKVKSFRIQKKLFMDNELKSCDYQKLVKAAINQGKKQIALIMEVMCTTGVRISELPFFTVENMKRKRIEVKNKGKIRMILIPDMIVKKLLCYAGKKGIQKGPIFVSRYGNPKNRSNIWKEMKAVAQAAGMDAEKVFPHNLRHLFARTFYKQTKNLTALADIMGHSSLEVTRIYTLESLDQYMGMINRVGSLEELKVELII